MPRVHNGVRDGSRGSRVPSTGGGGALSVAVQNPGVWSWVEGGGPVGGATGPRRGQGPRRGYGIRGCDGAGLWLASMPSQHHPPPLSVDRHSQCREVCTLRATGPPGG